MKKKNSSRELLKLNLLATLMIAGVDLLIFFLSDKSKSSFVISSIYTSFIILFIYMLMLIKLLERKLNAVKMEVMTINYPTSILTFFCILFVILIASAVCLFSINPEAAKISLIFTFFMSSILMFLPSFLLLVYIHFIVPAFVIPAIKNRKSLKNIGTLLLILFALLFFSGGFHLIKRFNTSHHIEKQTDFKGAKLSINYSTMHLKLGKNVSDYAKKLMSRDTAKVPFFYLEEPIPYSDYREADVFCRALGARVPNYLETYNIVFNRYDTFGDKYYWTSNKDGDMPLVLHFNNMSFEITRLPQNIKPELYCIVSSEKDYEVRSTYTFHRNLDYEIKETFNRDTGKTFNPDFIKDLMKIENIPQQTNPPQIPPPAMNINQEKKHVNFSVKEVSQDVFNQLLMKGYSYNSSDTIPQTYETNDAMLSSVLNRNTNKIRLCYYPFTDYGDMNIMQEKEIWQQSFCSPAFDLTNGTPVLKTRHEKDSYCISTGGRLPNIPELTGIIKTINFSRPNVRFWTNNTVNQLPVYVYYKDGRFLKAEIASPNSNDQAYAFCIRKPEVPSSVIANYKSRFPNTEGKYYARMQCPSCQYYEVPDVILQH